jgi:hypothetical protein
VAVYLRPQAKAARAHAGEGSSSEVPDACLLGLRA